MGMDTPAPDMVVNEVNFTSMLPRRGGIVVCPFCQTIVPAELTNF